MKPCKDIKKIIEFYLKPIFMAYILLVATGTFETQAQTLITEDKPAMDTLRKAVDLLYNFQFEKSEATARKIKPKYGSHPGYLLYSGLLSFWKHFPISAKPIEYKNYIKILNIVISQSENLTKKYPKSPEPDFFNLMANLMLGRHQSEDGEYIKAVNSTRKAYGFIKKGFDIKNIYPEYYFTTGLYNYYRVAFPENHPLYKSFTVFFPDGNKAQGIKELEIASQKSVFSKAESLAFLTMISLRDELNIPQALKFATILHENYPLNWLFSMIYGECLLTSKKPDLAEPIFSKLLMRTESSALLSGYYLKGLYEKQKGNPDAAKWAFQKGLMYGKSKDRLSKGYMGLCYNELGKIANDEGKKDWAKKYFGLALDNCSYKKVKEDAEAAGF